MRTTLEIDDDLLHAAKELARREGASAGAVISRLLRQALTGAGAPSTATVAAKAIGGFVPFPAKPGLLITQEHVDAVRDEEGV